VVGEPPGEIALALGDALHHARAALDNLVGVLRGGATDRSAFRIDTDPATFDRDHERRLGGVPDWARAAIREVQPFPDNPRRHVGETLADLNALAIADRHRALLLSAALIDLDQTGAAVSDGAETRFALHDGGRVLTLEYGIHDGVSATTGVQIIVPEDRLRWTGEGAGWPWYPEAADVASQSVQAARQAVEVVGWAAGRAGIGVR
jgi:hypothetical protein